MQTGWPWVAVARGTLGLRAQELVVALLGEAGVGLEGLAGEEDFVEGSLVEEGDLRGRGLGVVEAFGAEGAVF